jgi:hypothetical protein
MIPREDKAAEPEAEVGGTKLRSSGFGIFGVLARYLPEVLSGVRSVFV